MTDQRLTEILAVRVMGWRIAPGRFLKSDRAWIPRWRFAPLTDLRDAFALLSASEAGYILRHQPGGVFEAEVRIGRRMGRGQGNPQAQAITLAVASALGMDLPGSRPDA